MNVSVSARRVVQASVLILSAGLASCTSRTPPAPATTSTTPAAVAPKTVDRATSGSISGRIVFTGARPAMDHLKMASDPVCVQASGPNPTNDAVLIAPDGGLENVFVYIKDGLNPDYHFDVPTAPVLLDQKGCRYSPRVAGARVGQPVEITNSDPTFHNVHGMPTAGAEFNSFQPMRGMRERRIFAGVDVMVHFKCDVHSWMSAYVGVVNHPYFAVTSVNGRFAMPNVPPGTYTIEAWHERFGTRTAQVTIGDRQAGTVSLTFSAS
jgi:hypothetical protein